MLSIIIPYIVELLRCTEANLTRLDWKLLCSFFSGFTFHPKCSLSNETCPQTHLVISKMQFIFICTPPLYFQTDGDLSSVGWKLWANACFPLFPFVNIWWHTDGSWRGSVTDTESNAKLWIMFSDDVMTQRISWAVLKARTQSLPLSRTEPAAVQGDYEVHQQAAHTKL